MTPEGRVKAKVDALLKEFVAYSFKPVQNGMGKPGLDYQCVYAGLSLHIETKAPGKWPTARQLVTMTEIRRANGTVFLVRDDHDLQELRTWLVQPILGYLSRTAQASLSATTQRS